MRKLLLALALVVSSARAGAQVVERPEPFDSAGRLQIITPLVAARLQLAPPAWRITGDFREARLFSSGDGAWVLVVTRRDGAQERYAVTAADRDYLRARTANLPPGLAEQVTQSVTSTMREGLQGLQGLERPNGGTGFILTQSVLGLAVYAPSFAYAVTNEDAGRVASYLLVAGGTYFAAASLARDMRITPPQNVLAARASLSGGGTGFALAYAAGMSRDAKAAGIFVGSLAGTAAGLWFGRGVTSTEAIGANFTSDALALTAAGVLRATGTLDRERDGGEPKVAAVGIAAASLVGFPLGMRYARTTAYNVTGGDLGTLWVAGGIGTAAAATALAAVDTDSDAAIYLGLTTGFAAGVLAGDRLLVRRFDHSWGQSATVTAGALAGGLMGAGVAVLADTEDPSSTLVLGLMTAGAVAGVGAANWLTTTPADARSGTTTGARTGARRVRMDGAALAMAASGVPGRHALVTISF